MGNPFSRERRERRSIRRSHRRGIFSDVPSGPEPVEFSSIANTLATGDICLLYRAGMTQPHYAMFVRYEDLGDDSPLLLLKGKTKPLPLDKFEKGIREVRLVSASTRIFYGDYEKVLIRKLKKDKVIPGHQVDEAVEAVRNLKFSETELKIIEDESLSAESRSQYVCTIMLAHVLSQLGYLSVDPHLVAPKDFIDHLQLDDAITSIKLPETKAGPLVSHGSPPFFAKLM